MKITQKILLALYKAKRGQTWAMITRIRGISGDYAYQTLMKFCRQGLAVRRLSAIRGKYKSYRFYITEAGITRLQNKGILAPNEPDN